MSRKLNHKFDEEGFKMDHGLSADTAAVFKIGTKLGEGGFELWVETMHFKFRVEHLSQLYKLLSGHITTTST